MSGARPLFRRGPAHAFERGKPSAEQRLCATARDLHERSGHAVAEVQGPGGRQVHGALPLPRGPGPSDPCTVGAGPSPTPTTAQTGPPEPCASGALSYRPHSPPPPPARPRRFPRPSVTLFGSALQRKGPSIASRWGLRHNVTEGGGGGAGEWQTAAQGGLGPELGLRGGGGIGGVIEPKVQKFVHQKQPQSIFPFVKFHVFPR